VPDAPADRPDASLRRILSLRDVVGMTIVGVVGLRWIARSARAGAPAVTLWVLACVAFFVPLAFTVAELSSRYPEEGGLYAWTRRAFGPRHGFLCAWCLWLNNLFYFPSLLLFAAANAFVVFGDRGAWLINSRGASVAFVLVVLWICVWVNVVGLDLGRWLQNVGSAGVWLPAGLLIAMGAIGLARFGSATSFAPHALLPRGDVWSTVSLWSAMCFAFSGFEITAFVSREIKDPRRTIPRGVVIAGLATTAIYLAGAVAVLVVVPASALSERSGIPDAIALVAGRLGLPGFGALTGALIALGSIAGTSSWFAAAGRVPFAASEDALVPAWFGRLHPRYQTPYVALLVQGVVASLLFLASVFLSVTGAATSVQEAYDILVNLTILIYFIPYLYLFAALVRLRRKGDEGAPAAAVRVPGGRPGLWTTAALGLLATVISLGLLFVPPPGTGSVANYEANLIGQSAAVLALGALFYRLGRRRRRTAAPLAS